MTVEVGYITSWRRKIFLTLIFAIVFFGISSSVCTAYIPIKIFANIISLFVLFICVIMFVFVLADKNDRYAGKGTADIKEGIFVYGDKKRHYEIRLADIKKVDIEKISLGNAGEEKKPIAYRILIQTHKKKYYIESERARGRKYNEVDLYRLYIYLQDKISNQGGKQQ